MSSPADGSSVHHINPIRGAKGTNGVLFDHENNGATSKRSATNDINESFNDLRCKSERQFIDEQHRRIASKGDYEGETFTRALLQ